MPRSAKAPATPSVIKWARTTRRLSVEELARKVGKLPETIEAWENGDDSPTLAQLRTLAQACRRPLAVFFLPEPPRDFSVPLIDFRTLPRDAPREFSAELQFLLRTTLSKQEWAAEIRKLRGERVAIVGSASKSSDPVVLAREIRKRLQIEPNSHSLWKTSSAALRFWIDAAERLGIFVLQTSDIEPEEMRGFALADRWAPFAVVNSKDSMGARSFTLAHELAHLWIGASGVSNLEPIFVSRTENQRIERLCNAIAAEVIAPIATVKSVWDQSQSSNDLPERIRAVAARLRVSREVVARRLLQMQIISRDDYQELRLGFHTDWRADQERQRENLKGSDSFVPHSQLVISRNGRGLLRLAASALRSGETTGRDLSSALGLKLNHLEGVLRKANVG